MMKLFDLAGAESDRRFSPYCWRIRLALAHKGLDVETVAWRFSEKDALSASGQGKVPVLVHGDKWIYDSWEIALYLENTFSDLPTLFGGPEGVALSKLYSNLGDVIAGQISRFVLLDVYEHLDTNDKAYFRESREQRFGMSLEQVVAERESRLQGFRDGLVALRMTLKTQPFFGGDRPLYADFALFGPFQWARCISPFQLLAADDPIAQWRTRLLEEFNGLAGCAPGYDALS
jgi:glutathione S-transferase